MNRLMRNIRLLWRAESMLGAHRISKLARRSWFMVAIGLITLVQVWPVGAQMSAIVQVRDVALEELEADVIGIERALASTRTELRQLVRHPLESIAPTAVATLTKSILTSLRRGKTEMR